MNQDIKYTAGTWSVGGRVVKDYEREEVEQALMDLDLTDEEIERGLAVFDRLRGKNPDHTILTSFAEAEAMAQIGMEREMMLMYGKKEA